MANFESFAQGSPFAFCLYRLSADVQNCITLITLPHLALLCLTIFVMFVEQLIRNKWFVLVSFVSLCSFTTNLFNVSLFLSILNLRFRSNRQNRQRQKILTAKIKQDSTKILMILFAHQTRMRKFHIFCANTHQHIPYGSQNDFYTMVLNFVAPRAHVQLSNAPYQTHLHLP